MKRGIELLKARTAEHPFNNAALLDNGILLPPIFLAFIQCVQTGDLYGFFKLEKGAEFEQDHPFSDCVGFAQSDLAESELYSSKPSSGRMGG